MRQETRGSEVPWHPPGPLPARVGPPPTSSGASCSPASEAADRTCTFTGVCFDAASKDFGYFGGARADTEVSLSTFLDGRSLWRPLPQSPPEGPVAWLDLPTYVAIRHAPQNWGHHVVETYLGLYALVLASEDVVEPHGRRHVFFLDDCSLNLHGDAIEYCMSFVPDPLHCIMEIPDNCAKFSQQLWPLLSDFAPLEVSSARDLVGPDAPRHLCFSSLHAGLGPWRRPMQPEKTPGVLSWAADPLMAPVVRLFRGLAARRLGVPPAAPAAPRTLVCAVKSARRSVTNRAELVLWLRDAAAEYTLSFTEMDFARPLNEQLATLSTARLLVASAGSAQFSGLFLRVWSSVLVMPMCVSAMSGGVMDCHAEQLLAGCGLQWAQYPAEWEDLHYSIGRGFDFEVRREVLDPLVRGLLARP